MAKSKMRKYAMPKLTDKVVIAKYIRVSTDKQREEGYSIDIQKERLTGYTRSMFPPEQYDVEYREYVDDGFSGGSLDRPRMNDLMEDVKNGEITHVVVVKLDRLSRSQKDTLYLIEDVFLPHNVAFISMGESFNTATPFGRAVVGILSVFAQLERENIYERTRSGMQKRVELGYWPGGGGVPFGYDYDREQGILVPNKDAETVRRIYDLYLQGYGEQTIADMCGLKYDKIVHGILARKSNTGVIVYNGVEYQGRHEPIISLETYQKAMLVMLERSGKKFTSATDHLLTGLLRCGKCGARMRYQKWGSAGTKLVCYSQQKSKAYMIKDAACSNARPWADDVEALVLDVVFRRAKETVEREKPGAEACTALNVLENQHNELTKKLKRLYNLYAEGTDNALLGSIQDAKKVLLQLEKRIEIESERAMVSQAAEMSRRNLDTLKDCWEYMTLTEKRNVLRSVLNEVVITENSVHVDFSS